MSGRDPYESINPVVGADIIRPKTFKNNSELCIKKSALPKQSGLIC